MLSFIMGCITTITTINLHNDNNTTPQQPEPPHTQARDRVITLFETIVTHAIATQAATTTTGNTSMAKQPTTSENTTVATRDRSVAPDAPRAAIPHTCLEHDMCVEPH